MPYEIKNSAITHLERGQFEVRTRDRHGIHHGHDSIASPREHRGGAAARAGRASNQHRAYTPLGNMTSVLRLHVGQHKGGDDGGGPSGGAAGRRTSSVGGRPETSGPAVGRASSSAAGDGKDGASGEKSGAAVRPATAGAPPEKRYAPSPRFGRAQQVQWSLGYDLDEVHAEHLGPSKTRNGYSKLRSEVEAGARRVMGVKAGRKFFDYVRPHTADDRYANAGDVYNLTCAIPALIISPTERRGRVATVQQLSSMTTLPPAYNSRAPTPACTCSVVPARSPEL